MSRPMQLFPPPRSAHLGSPGDRRFASIAPQDDPCAPTILETLGTPAEPAGASLPVACRRVSDDELERDPITGVRHNEGYRISAQNEGSGALLEYAGDRGLRYGLATLQTLLDTRTWGAEVRITDAPRFAIRGVIEGYYGPPWSPQARAEVLETAARRRMNAYFYGPKDDLYHRERWRDRYPDALLDEMKSAFELTGRLGMDFWYTIGPGLTMSYADEADRAALLAKLEQIVDLGITRIGLLFDDIPAALQHEADIARYATLADAHADVSNSLHASLRERFPEIRLVVCPTRYHGSGTEPYITRLGERLDPRIEVFWTGPEICSRELTLRDAALLDRTLSRPALYWDNYPVNDLEMAGELHIGPYRGRDPHLYRASIGVVANGMEYPDATRIPLLTIADYLWNPEAYDPEASWTDAIRTIVGEKDAPAFQIFADNNRYSAIYTTNSPRLVEHLHEAEFLNATDRPTQAAAVLTAAVEELGRAIELFDRGMENGKLEREIEPWIRKFRAGVELIDACRASRAGEAGAGPRVAAARLAYRLHKTYVFADVLNSLL